MAKKPESCELRREEWDFSTVADAELETCVFYEYARECISFIGYQLKRSLESTGKETKQPRDPKAVEKIAMLREILSVIQAQGFDEENFLANYYDTDCGYAEADPIL